MKKIVTVFLSFLLLISLGENGFSATKKKKKKGVTQTEQTVPVESVSPAAQAVPPPTEPPPPVTWHEKFEAGWKKGLYFQTKDKKYSLRFRGRIQPRFTYTALSNKKANSPNSVGFQIRRAQLNWQGNVFSQNLDYNFQINLAVSQADEILEDAWLDYRFYNPLRVQIGQFPIPYIRQFITSAGRLQFVDRSIAAEDFRFSGWNTTTTCTVAGATPGTTVNVNCPSGTTAASSIRRYRYDLGLMVHGDAFNNKFE